MSTSVLGAEYFAALLCPPSCEQALIDQVLDRLGIDHLLYDLLETKSEREMPTILLKGNIQSLQKDGFIDESRELTRFGRAIIYDSPRADSRKTGPRGYYSHAPSPDISPCTLKELQMNAFEEG